MSYRITICKTSARGAESHCPRFGAPDCALLVNRLMTAKRSARQPISIRNSLAGAMKGAKKK